MLVFGLLVKEIRVGDNQFIMGWLGLSLLAALLWAISGLLEKDALDHGRWRPITLSAVVGVFALIVPVFTLTQEWVIHPTIGQLALMFISGTIPWFVYWPYFRALKSASSTTVQIMWNITPVYIVLFAWVIFSEKLLPADYIAIIMLIASSVIASYQPIVKNGSHLAKALPLMLLATLLWAVEQIIDKHLYSVMPVIPVLGWTSLLWSVEAIFVAVFHKPTREFFTVNFFTRSFKDLTVSNVFNAVASISRALAVSLGPISLIQAVFGIQPLFSMIFAGIFGVIGFSKVRKLTRLQILQTLVAIIFALIGLFLIKPFA